MNIKIFAATLAASLIDRGIDSDTAKSHVLSLTRTLTEEDLAEIAQYNTAADFETLTDSLTGLIREKQARSEEAEREAKRAVILRENQKTRVGSPLVKSGTDSATDMKTKAIDLAGLRLTDEAPETPDSDMMKTRVGSFADESTEPEIYLDEKIENEIYVAPEIDKVRLTPRGAAFFWIIGILTLPLTAGFSAAVLSIFAVGFLAVCILIAASFVLVAAEVICGTGAALVGIIYGIIVIFTSSVGIGLFEMGLGVVFAGVALLLGVLTYNFAVLVLPYVLRQLASVFKKFLVQIKSAVGRFREECNRL